MGKIAASFWERHIHNLISEREVCIHYSTRHVFVKHGCHRRQQSPNLESPTF